MSELSSSSPAASRASSPLHRRSLLKAIGLGGVLAGTGLAVGASPLAELLDLGAAPAGATPTSCATGPRLADLRIVGGNLSATLGLSGVDVRQTTDGGTSFVNNKAPAVGNTFIPYCLGTNGAAGGFGIGGDHGWVQIYDATTSTWRSRQVGGGSPTITALAGNGAYWVAVANSGAFWWTADNGASWKAATGGTSLDYRSIASILSVEDLTYANGVWVGAGYDTLGGGRTFWRSTKANPSVGARTNWFSVVPGDFAEVVGTGDGNLVTVYAVTFAGTCHGNGTTWYGAGNFGTVWRSTDNGGSWSKWRDSGDQIHYGVDVNPVSGKVLCASGLDGILEVNPSVAQRYAAPLQEIYDIAWCGGSTWVACGDFSQLLVSRDDGVSWVRAAVPVTGGLDLFLGIARLWG